MEITSSITYKNDRKTTSLTYDKEVTITMARLDKVRVLFSDVSTIDDFSGKYQIVVQLTEEAAADAEASGLKVKVKEHDGKTQHQITFKSKFRPRIVGLSGQKDLDLGGGEIGRGSIVNIQHKARNYTTPAGQSGVAHDLIAVQVLDMEAPNASEFGDETGFGETEEDM